MSSSSPPGKKNTLPLSRLLNPAQDIGGEEKGAVKANFLSYLEKLPDELGKDELTFSEKQREVGFCMHSAIASSSQGVGGVPTTANEIISFWPLSCRCEASIAPTVLCVSMSV